MQATRDPVLRCSWQRCSLLIEPLCQTKVAPPPRLGQARKCLRYYGVRVLWRVWVRGSSGASNPRTSMTAGPAPEVAARIRLPWSLESRNWFVYLHIARFESGLIQLGVLCLGLFQDGNVRIGILPSGEEILVGDAGFGGVSRENQTSRQAEPGHGHVRGGPESRFVIENFLKLGHGLRALFGVEIGETAQINRLAIRNVAELIALGGTQLFDGLCAIAALQGDPGANLRN